MTSISNDIELLGSVEDISGAWVQAALGTSEIEVPDISHVSFEPIGHGNTNETYKLDLRYTAPPDSAPESLIFKIHSSNPDTSQRAGQAGAYRCEHEMSAILGSVPDILTPHFFHSAISEDGCRSNILDLFRNR